MYEFDIIYATEFISVTSIDVLPSKNQAMCEYCTHNDTFK